jgi:hypothetical protein
MPKLVTGDSTLDKWAQDVDRRLNEAIDEALRAQNAEFIFQQAERKELIKNSQSLSGIVSTLPMLTGGFTYTSTTTSVTWNWANLQLFYPNGTTKQLPDGSNTITGLSAGTYYFYPFYDSKRGVLDWVPGDAGTAAIAHTAVTLSAAQWQLHDRFVPLSGGAISAVVPGAGSGSGGGGGSGCLAAGTLVETLERGFIPVEFINLHEHIRSPKGWTEVIKTRQNLQHQVIEVVTPAETIQCSVSHPWVTERGLQADEYTAAEDLVEGDKIISLINPLAVTKIRKLYRTTLFVALACEPYHEFYCTESLALTHNAIAPKA